MLCNNCKAEIPADAKFCPMCGAKNEPAPQPKTEQLCKGCGVILEAGAKFCTLCGTPVEGAAAQPTSMGYAGNVDAAPAASAIPTPVNDTAAKPVSAIPTPVNDTAAKPVSAIPTPVNDTAAKPVSAIPTPVNDTAAKPVSAIPTPVNDTAVKPVSAIPTPVNGGTAQPVFNSVPTPANGSVDLNKTTSNAQDSSSFTVPSYDYSMGADAAAVSAKPIKKKNIALPIILCVLAVLILAGGIIFLVNRSAVMQLFMGDSGYARMIEGNGIKSVTQLAAQPSVAAGMESALSAAAAAAAAENLDTDSLSSYSEAININQYINTVSASMQDAYGTNGANIDIDFDLSLTDTAKAALLGEGADTADLDDALDFINATEITYRAGVTEDAISAYAAVYDGTGLAFDAEGLVYSDGSVVIKFPFGSDRCIVATIDEESITTEEAPALDLDEKEFSRLAGELVDLYLAAYEQGEVVIEEGDYTIGGVTATGKRITVTLSAEQLNKLFTDAAELIAEDEYFCKTIVDYINDCGGLMTYDEFKTEIKDAGAELAVLDEGTDYMEVMTIVNNSNTVLAKCYTFYDDYEDGEGDVAVIGYINGETAFALEIGSAEESSIIAVVEKTSDTDGRADVKIYDNGEYVMTVKVNYTGVKSEQYNGNDMTVGSFDISFEMPQDFTADTDDMMTMLSTVSIRYSVNLGEIEGKKAISCNLALDVPQYFTFALDTVTTPIDMEIPAALPADAIDVTALLENEGEPTDADLDAIDELAAMVDDIAAAADKMSDDSIYKELLLTLTEQLKASVDELKNPTADFDAVYDVIDEFYELNDRLYTIQSTYPEGYDAIFADITAVEDKLNALSDELFTFDVTAARLAEIESEMSSLGSEITALEAAAKAAQEKYDEEKAAADAVNYNDLGYEELLERAYELEDRFYTAVFDNYDALLSDDGLYSLYEDAQDTYDDMAEAVNDMIDQIESGNMNAQYVRNARKALEAFDEDITAFENALTNISDTAA